MTKYGPKSALSPSIGDPCPLCSRPLLVGDYTTLVARSPEHRFADSAEVHWRCALAAHRC
jgi:hypothetical protein